MKDLLAELSIKFPGRFSQLEKKRFIEYIQSFAKDEDLILVPYTRNRSEHFILKKHETVSKYIVVAYDTPMKLLNRSLSVNVLDKDKNKKRLKKEALTRFLLGTIVLIPTLLSLWFALNDPTSALITLPRLVLLVGMVFLFRLWSVSSSKNSMTFNTAALALALSIAKEDTHTGILLIDNGYRFSEMDDIIACIPGSKPILVLEALNGEHPLILSGTINSKLSEDLNVTVNQTDIPYSHFSSGILKGHDVLVRCPYGNTDFKVDIKQLEALHSALLKW